MNTNRKRLEVIGAEFGWFAGFFLLAIAMTWPLARGLSKFVSDTGDPMLLTWTLDWDHWATLHQPHHLFDANMFFPARYALAFSENVYGIALVTFPLYFAGLSPITIYNLALILGFAFSGYGAFVLARQITSSPLAALAAGVFFELVPFRFNHLPHLQHVWSGWLPLMFAALLTYAARPSWSRATLFAASFLMNGLTNIHWLLFGSLAVFLLAVFLAASREGSVRDWIPLAVATLCAGLVLLPFLLPYQRASDLYGMKRSVEETEHYSATASDWLIAPPANGLYGSPKIGGEAERRLFPGFLALILAAAAIFLASDREGVAVDLRKRRPALLRTLDVSAGLLFIAAAWVAGHPTASITSPLLRLGDRVDASIPFTLALAIVVVRFWIRLPRAFGDRSFRDVARLRSEAFWSALILCALGFVGSLGFHAFLHRALFHVTAFQSIRVPARWAMIAYAGLAMLVAIGIVAIASRMRTAVARRLVAAAFVVLFVLELRPRRFTWYTIVDPAPAVAKWLATQTVHGGVLELPLTARYANEVAYLLPATVHHKLLLNGASGFETPDHSALARAFAQDPISAEAIELLEKLRCSTIVLHADDPASRSAAMRSWLRENLASGRLHLVRRFDRGMRGDYIFTLSRDASRATVDANSQEALTRYLDRDAPSYNPSAVEMLDTPKPGETIVGPLRLAGWAVSPHGVRAVRLHLQNGSVILDAKCVSRLDVNRLLPWYREGCGAGFEATIGKRPREVLKTTDVVVEVIDAGGASKRFPPVFFNWFVGK